MPSAVPAPEGRAARPAAFLDRDGTVMVERHYPADPEQVELISGALAALRDLRSAGYALIIVSNQSGIARGLYGEAERRGVQERFEALLAEAGVRLDGAYFCPHHPDFTGPCDCRKPAAGLFRVAAAELGLDLTRSVYIGDRLRDVLPARELGGTAILVRTGYGRKEEPAAPADVAVVDDLAAAASRAISGLTPAAPSG